MDINLIRAAYPNPKTSREGAMWTDYCIGGALCLYYELIEQYGNDGRYPDRHMLALILRDANPLLPEREAMNAARMIIANNDEGLFETAWRTADLAVNYHPEETD